MIVKPIMEYLEQIAWEEVQQYVLAGALIAAAAGFACYISPWPNGNASATAPQTLESITLPSLSLSPAVYLDSLSKSALLGSPEVAPVAVARGPSASELAKDLRLKGIVAINEPEALIQDARTQKTILTKVGDAVAELQVKEIGADYIILEHQKDEIKLTI